MSKIQSGKVPYSGRTLGRLAAVQALFQIEQTEESASAVVLEFLDIRLKKKEKGRQKIDTTFFANLVEGAWACHEKSDEILKGAIKAGWSLDRIESVSRAIFRAALYELIETQTPSAVIIDEYLNITHSFFNDSEVSFVNGVLNTLSQKIRPRTSI